MKYKMIKAVVSHLAAGEVVRINTVIGVVEGITADKIWTVLRIRGLVKKTWMISYNMNSKAIVEKFDTKSVIKLKVLYDV